MRRHPDARRRAGYEYALILALVAIVAIVAIVALIFPGGQVSTILSKVGNSVWHSPGAAVAPNFPRRERHPKRFHVPADLRP